MYGEQGVKAVHKMVHSVKLRGKGCSIFFFLDFEGNSYYATKGYKVVYGTYLAAQQHNKLIQFPVFANICVLFSLEILPQACEKHIQTFNSDNSNSPLTRTKFPFPGGSTQKLEFWFL